MNISEEQLMLLHMGELSPEESAELLKSAEVCKQLELLEADMQAFEAQNQNTLPEDYGHQLWNQISEKIESRDAQFRKGDPIAELFKRIVNWFHTPQFSFASMAMVAMLVVTAYWMGRQDVIDNTDFSQQLLAQNIQMHLTQSEIFLTQVSHATDASSATELQTMAQRLLISNRIYKQALAGYESQFTQQVLSDLEPVLLEVANRSNAQMASTPVIGNNASASQKLLFQVKSMKKQLANDNTII